MNKKLSAALLGLSLMGAVGTANAAAPISIFADVPEGDWTYDAIRQLSEDGLVEAYKDGYFRGQKTITRYEMAIITGNAMTKAENASAEDKALVERLYEEFTPELRQLNIQVEPQDGATEEAQPPAEAPPKPTIIFSGEDRVRFEHAKNSENSKSKTYNRFRLNMLAPLTEKLAFVGRIEAENRAGTTSDVNVTQAFLTGHDNIGEKFFAAGRIPLHLGQGLINGIGAEGAWNSGADGLAICFGNKLMVTAAAGKAGNGDELGGLRGADTGTSLNLFAGNLEYVGIKDLSLTAAYLADKRSAFIKTYGLGASYTGLKDWTFTGEYGANDAEIAHTLNDNSEAKAFFIKAQYKKADPKQVNSYGVWLRYRMAEPGFDPLSMNDLDAPEVMKNFDATNPFAAYNMSNVKGFDIGFDYTLFKNGVLSMNYAPLRQKTTRYNAPGQSDKADYFMTSLTYFF